MSAFVPAGFASADNAAQIEALCAARFAQDANAQASCRSRQSAAIAALMDRIELAVEGSREYKAANTCIERAKVKPPAQVDWTNALRCYENRMGAGNAP